MAHVYADRVKQLTRGTGAGALELGAAAFGYRAFSDVMTDGDTADVCILDRITGAWEVCSATLTAPTVLARGTLRASSTGGRVIFRAGVKEVFLVQCAAEVMRRTDILAAIAAGGGGGSAPLLSLSISDDGTDIVPGVVGYAHWPFDGGGVDSIALGLSVAPSGGSLSISAAYFDGAAWQSIEPNVLPATFAAGVDFWRSTPGPGLDDEPLPLPTIPRGSKLRFTAAGAGTGARGLKVYLAPAANVGS